MIRISAVQPRLDMRKIPILIALALTVGCAAEQPTRDETAGDVFRVVQQADVALRPAGASSSRDAAGRVFSAGAIRGTLQDDGTWTLRTEVAHTRLRCATYETGIRLGIGDGSCANARWLTDIERATRQTQCNAATVIHSGGGEIDLPTDAIESANCVRVLVGCTGGAC